MKKIEESLLYFQDSSFDEDSELEFFNPEKMYHHLRQRIISLKLCPGQNLSRTNLVKYYGLSQTPVRDVVIRLKQEGLVNIYPQSRTVVAKINLQHARQTQFLRVALELEVSRILALDKDKTKLTTARYVLDLQQIALKENSLDKFSQLDRNFHKALFNATGNDKLWGEISTRSGHIDRIRKLHLPNAGKAANILDYHNKILSAIENSDEKLTETMIREHLSGTLSIVNEFVKQYPDFFLQAEQRSPI